ncbi:MAG: hypothetical protein AAB345_03135 [Patescibacteria group bacterium]
MKKLALLAFVAVVSFGFVGCVTSNPEPPEPAKETVYLPVAIKFVEYDATSDKTKVVLSVTYGRNHSVDVDGDQRSYFKAGALGLRLELLAVYFDENGEIGKVYLLTDVQGKKYPVLVSDTKPKPAQ